MSTFVAKTLIIKLTHMNQQDLDQIKARGISEAKLEKQLNQFKTGFPFLKLEGAAAINKGIIAPADAEQKAYISTWEDYKNEGHKILKFVPASGAASRMFKNLFEFLSADYNVPTTDFEKNFFNNIKKFAFYKALDAQCVKNENGKHIEELISEGNFKNRMIKPRNIQSKSKNGKNFYLCQRISSTFIPSANRFRSTQFHIPGILPFLENCHMS